MITVDIPCFITPHAIDRFQARYDALPESEVIEVILWQLQRRRRVSDPKKPKEMYYQGYYQGRAFYCLIGEGEGEWPSVVTVIDDRSALHGNVCKGIATVSHQEPPCPPHSK